MRLKQLLGIVLLASATALAAATVSQLGGVLVKNQDSAAVITILANGTFTHTEYRPTDNLMLVDLAGVSTANQDAKVHEVAAPGVRSYRITGYRSANGAEVARMELTLARDAKVNVAEVEGGLELRVSGSPASAPARSDVATSSSIQKTVAATRIREISVAQGGDALNIEISGSGPMTARTMKLTHPDRVVVDIPNSVLQGRAREIPVNTSDVKTVRAARYQEGTTRVVVDMAQMRDFQVVPEGNKLVVTLRENSSVRPSPLPEKKQAVVTAEAHPQPVRPAETSKPAEKTVEATPSRADTAASHFAGPQPALPSINQPPYV